MTNTTYRRSGFRNHVVVSVAKQSPACHTLVLPWKGSDMYKPGRGGGGGGHGH